MDLEKMTFTRFAEHAKKIETAAFHALAETCGKTLYQTRVKDVGYNGIAERDKTAMRAQKMITCLHDVAHERDLFAEFEKALVTGMQSGILHYANCDKARQAHYAYTIPGHMTSAKAEAISYYASSGSSLNEALRRLYYTDAATRHVPVLDKLMQPLPQTLTLYRGFSLPKDSDIPLKAGDIFVERGFMGTSSNRSKANSFAHENSEYSHRQCYMLELEVPRGTPYASIWKGVARYHDYVDGEQEIILGRGCEIVFDEDITDTVNDAHHGVQVWKARIVGRKRTTIRRTNKPRRRH